MLTHGPNSSRFGCERKISFDFLHKNLSSDSVRLTGLSGLYLN